MLLPNQLIEVKIRKNYIEHYQQFGYDIKSGDIIYVPPEHLPNSSNKKVTVICDECGKRIDKTYQKYISGHQYNLDTCNQCKYIKSKQTNLEKYGGNSPMSSKEIQLKSQQTNIKKYGVPYIMQNPDVFQHFKQVIFDRYGVENPSQSDEIKEKKKKTSILHFGVEHPMQLVEMQERVRTTMTHNGTVATSSQQIKLYNIIKNKYPEAMLNYPFSTCSLDIFICIDNIPIDIEYDCWYFHQDAHKDIRRDKFLQSQGFKTLRVRSAYKMPTEQELFDAIDYLVNTEHRFKEIILSDWKQKEGELCQEQLQVAV